MSRLARAALALIAIAGAHAAQYQVTIYRDTFGVPHIYGKTDAAVAYGMMYAQAEDNFWQLEDDYLQTLGRAAEVYGPARLTNDVVVRAWEPAKRAREHYAKADGKLRALCDGFAAGVNRYLERHPEIHPRLLTHWEPWFILAMEHSGPAGAGITRAERELAFPALKGAAEIVDAADADEGSNMWAVAPSRSASGHALLLINPHVGFFGGGQRYEAHLHSGEGLDVSGFAILGTPYIRSGHNASLGWSHTNNYAQTADVYLEPEAALQSAAQWTEAIPVKSATGIEMRQLTFRKTQHGPVLGMRGGRALTVRAVSAEGGAMAQRWAMARARNLAEFQAAMARLALTGSNTIYADVKGNIYYLHGNAIPRRNPKFDWSKPVDGGDPATEWRGLHKLDELPQLLNPKSGWLQNCNSTVFLTSAPEDNLTPDRYPSYMAPEADTPRSQRSRAILQGSSRFTFEEWTRLGLDSKIGIAAARIAELVAQWEKSDAARKSRVAELVGELRAWDQVARVDSVPATLFVRTELAARAGAAAAPDALVAGLEKVKVELEAAFGTWRVPWGEINRLQRIHSSGTQEQFSDARPSVGVPGAPSFSGTIFTFGTRAAPGQKRMYGTVGNTYISVVEFGKKVEARSLLVFGESADPASPHHTDQAELYGGQKFKPAWFSLSDVRRHLERKYQP